MKNSKAQTKKYKYPHETQSKREGPVYIYVLHKGKILLKKKKNPANYKKFPVHLLKQFLFLYKFYLF